MSSFRNCIKLADAFIAEFEESEELIDVVPFYYGSLWLANAVSLATLGAPRLKERAPGHGLSVIGARHRKYQILNTKVNVGTEFEAFSLLNEALGGDSVHGNTFELLELLKGLPPMRDHLDRVGAKSTAVEFSLRSFDEVAAAILDGQINGALNNITTLTPEYLRDHLVAYRYLEARQLAIEASGASISWKRLRPEQEERLAVLVPTPGGEFFLPKIDKHIVSELAIYVGALFVLAHFARYQPDIWIDVFEKRTDESFVIREFVHAAQEVVPTLVLNHLSRCMYEFRTT